VVLAHHGREVAQADQRLAFPATTAVEAAKARLFEVVAQVVQRAQQSGNSEPTSPSKTLPW
jgi:hypothetical protein